MGRLNYTNVRQAIVQGPEDTDVRLQRKINGVKMGQVVAKDLVCTTHRVSPVELHASIWLMECDTGKTKRIPPALCSKAALRDPVVEIDLRSKQLTDAGLIEVTTALAKSTQHTSPQGKVVLLEELCLKDNGLTVASLSGLTSCMHLICDDLRDLDLSENSISVNDPDDVLPWEAFLQSLSQCSVLRRLDLSGNELGTKAFEVLARVYAQEGPLDLVLSKELEDLERDSVTDREHLLSYISSIAFLLSLANFSVGPGIVEPNATLIILISLTRVSGLHLATGNFF